MAAQAKVGLDEGNPFDPQEQNPDQVVEGDLLDQMLQQARDTGEELIDPRSGKQENAQIVTVELRGDGEKAHPMIQWGNLFDTEGKEFTIDDHLYNLKPGHPVFVKQRYMTKLKELDIVPRDFKQALMITNPAEAQVLTNKLATLIGQCWPITITQDNEGFHKITVRKRPKQQN